MWNIFFRSIFLQTLWNFQRMQNLGWAFSYWPALRRFHEEAAERRARIMEHLEYFNTHPYLANLILGVAAGLEEERALGGPVRADQILAAKKYMSGPLAALGDTLFWATARPFLGVLSIALGWVFARQSWWLVPFLFLGLYNVMHLLVRGGGLAAGYRLKTQVVPFLMRMNLQKMVRSVYLIGAGISLGALVTLWLGFGNGRWMAGVFAAVLLAALRWGVSSTQAFYTVIMASAAFVFLGGF